MKSATFFCSVLFILSACQNPDNTARPTEEHNITEVSSPADSSTSEPYLFTDKNGLVYLSWIHTGKELSSLKFSRFNDERWSPPIVIGSGVDWFVNWADYPQIVADGANNIAAHFLQKSAPGTYTYDIKLVTSTDGGSTWTVPAILHDDGKKAEHGFVSMAPIEEEYFVSWLDGRNATSPEAGKNHDGHHGQMTLRAALVSRQGKKSAEWELDDRVCDCCQTSVAITNNGPVVVYRDRSMEEIRDISIVRFEGGRWSSPKPIFSDNWKIDGCPVNGPQVAANGNNLAVAWFTAPDKQAQVNVIFSTDGGASFGKPVRIDEGKPIGRVDILMLDETSAMVSWMEASRIKAVKVHVNGSKDTPMEIAATSDSRSSGFPQMTKSGNNLFFAWSDVKEKRIKLVRVSL